MNLFIEVTQTGRPSELIPVSRTQNLRSLIMDIKKSFMNAGYRLHGDIRGLDGRIIARNAREERSFHVLAL
jgi:hypothetical protein